MEEKYQKCLEIVLQKEEEDENRGRRCPGMENEIRSVINCVDEFGNSPIHYATQLWSQVRNDKLRSLHFLIFANDP